MIHIAGPVMVVDDDADIREALTDLLMDEGLAVLAAGDGREALSLLQRGARPAAILLDLMMPVMDGVQFAARLRLDLALPHPPIVILSASRDCEGPARSIGAAAYLGKPVDVDQLLQALERVATPGGGFALAP